MLTTRQPRTLRDRLQLAAFAMVVLVISIAAALHLGGPETSPFAHLFGDDLVPSYMAGTFVREGRTELLTDYPAAERFQSQLRVQAGLEQHGRTGPWLNPPFYAAMFVPLSALPYRAALWTWFAANLLILSAAIVLLYRMLPADKRRPRDGAIIAALVVVSMPALQAMACQQNTFLSLLILCSAITLARSDRAFAAGAVGALLLFKPQLAVIVCGALVCTLGRRAIAGMIVTSAVLLAATLAFMPGAIGDYLHKLPGLLPYLRTDRPYPWERQTTFLGFWRLLITGRTGGPNPAIVTVLWMIGAVVVAAMLVGPLCKAFTLSVFTTKAQRARSVTKRTSSRSRDSLLAATIAASPLLMPYYMDYDLLLLTVPAVLLAAERMQAGRQPGDRWLIAGWAAVYAWMYFNAAVADATGVSVIVLLMSARFFGSLRNLGAGPWFARSPNDHGQASTLAHATQSTDAPTPHRRCSFLGRATMLSLAAASIAIPMAVAAGVLDRAKPLTFGHDLLPTYVAGRLVVEGRAGAMYDAEVIRATARPIIDQQNLTNEVSQSLWINPPGFAAVFAPLALMPYRAALLVWIGLNAALATAALGIILRWIPDRRPALLLGIAAITSCPFLLAVEHQQNTFISLAILTAALVAWRRGYVLIAGMLIGLLSLKPQLAITVGIALWMLEGRRALAGMLLTSLALLAAGELLSPGLTWQFLTQVPQQAGLLQLHPGYNWGRQMTPTAALRALLGVESRVAVVVGHVVSVAIVLLVGWAAWRVRCHTAGSSNAVAPSANRQRVIALAFTAMPLCAPYFMDYDLLLMVIPVALLSGLGWTRSIVGPGVVLWLILYLNVDLVAATHINAAVLCLLILFALQWRGLLRSKPAERLLSGSAGGGLYFGGTTTA